METFQNQAASWFQINISFELKEHSFTEVLNRLNKHNDKEKFIVYTSKTFKERHGFNNLCESLSEENTIIFIIIIMNCIMC